MHPPFLLFYREGRCDVKLAAAGKALYNWGKGGAVMKILITGAGGGMGLAACRRLSQAGHEVYGLDIHAPQSSEGWHFRQTDLTSEQEVAAAAEAFSDLRFDAVIHHAGIYDLNSLIEMPPESVQKIFDVNLFATMRVNRLFLSLLAEHATVVLTSSELAPLDPLPFTGIYGITKTAVEKYAFSLRMELQLLGHRVCVLRPGAVKTPLLDVSTEKLDRFCEKTTHYRCNAERFRKIVNSVEAKGVSPEKIAKIDEKLITAKHPPYIRSCNRNIGLRLLNVLPAHLQTAIIRRILSP